MSPRIRSPVRRVTTWPGALRAEQPYRRGAQLARLCYRSASTPAACINLCRHEHTGDPCGSTAAALSQSTRALPFVVSHAALQSEGRHRLPTHRVARQHADRSLCVRRYSMRVCSRISRSDGELLALAHERWIALASRSQADKPLSHLIDAKCREGYAP